jgi:GNAT superfamily N-acetyltransferase
MNISIEIAQTAQQFEVAKKIFIAYAEFLELDLEFQGFTQELQDIQTMYGKPNGCLILAKVDNEYAGAVGLRKLYSDDKNQSNADELHILHIAEMKRMFVLPQFHGKRLGELMCKSFIEIAKQLGYSQIKLDSLGKLNKAIGLYKKFGFTEIESYRYNPHADAIYMGLSI